VFDARLMRLIKPVIHLFIHSHTEMVYLPAGSHPLQY